MKRAQYMIVSVVGIVVLLLIFGSQMFYVLKPGERAVVFKKFTTGLDKDNILIHGFHVIAPWNDLIRYDVKEQKAEETMDVLDKGGLSINVDVTIIFNPFYDKIGYLHENIGINFVSVMLIPNVRSAVRAVTGRYSAEEIYSTKRGEVESEIIETTRTARETSEADRLRIQAQGIADYNRIISQSLTSNILKQKGIDATLELANSANSKVVVIGSGDDGMPLILGGN